ELCRVSGTALGDQRQPPPIVDVREDPRPVRRQALHHGEESLIRALRAKAPVRLDQPGRVAGPDRADVQLAPVAQRDVLLELPRIGRRGRVAGLAQRRLQSGRVAFTRASDEGSDAERRAHATAWTLDVRGPGLRATAARRLAMIDGPDGACRVS